MKHYLVCDFLVILFRLVNLVHDNWHQDTHCFVLVFLCFHDILLTAQVAGVAKTALELVIVLFLDIFSIFAPRIGGVLPTFIGLLTTEFAALLSNFNGLFDSVIEYGNVFTAILASSLISKLCGQCGDGIISITTSGFVYSFNGYCNGFNFGCNAVLLAANIEAVVVTVRRKCFAPSPIVGALTTVTAIQFNVKLKLKIQITIWCESQWHKFMSVGCNMINHHQAT